MSRYFLLILMLQLMVQTNFGQAASVPYGDNPTAGKYISVRGIRMYTEIYGQGKPLLLIHGNGGSISAFAGIIPALSKKYKVIAVDSRAQGKTIDAQDSISFEMMADDFAALLDALHIDSTYVIGWSDGGINALLLAMRHPDKVIRLASTGANITADPSAFTETEWNELKKTYEAGKNKVHSSAQEKNEWKIFMLDWTQPDIPVKQLGTIRCPALIICGDHDVIALEHTIKIFKHIPNARLWVVPNSGHGTLEEHRDEFIRQVDHFFTEPIQSETR